MRERMEVSSVSFSSMAVRSWRRRSSKPVRSFLEFGGGVLVFEHLHFEGAVVLAVVADAVLKVDDLGLALDHEIAQLVDAALHGALLVLLGLVGAALDGEFGLKLVESFALFLQALLQAVGFVLEVGEFVFEGADLALGSDEFGFAIGAGISGALDAIAGVFALGLEALELAFEVFDFALGE